MTKGFIVSGTDTNIGKTTVAALLTLGLDAIYWKAIQSGTEDGTDRERVKAMTGLPDQNFLPERYVLSHPLSPHRAAELDGVTIDAENLSLPTIESPLIVEGAGGLMVPITRQKLQIDLFKAWGLPIVLCARTELGTINHTLLSVEALRQRNISVHGIIFVGEDNRDTLETIAAFSQTRILGRVPYLNVIDRAALTTVFAENFQTEDFQ
jgi:dethiobiotin synthetase